MAKLSNELIDKLNAIQQGHLLVHLEALTPEESRQLAIQIASINISTFHQQQELLKQNTIINETFLPFTDYAQSGNLKDIEKGQELISQGQVGCLLIAGGQGTRLKIEGPKGTFPITPIKHKSLFQFFAERVAAASRLAGRQLKIAIMTSPLNHVETVEFFQTHHFFGLAQEQIDFFQQGMLPFLDRAGNLFLEEKGKIAEGPDGNGGSLKQFVKTPIFQKWRQEGINYLNYILVDNPLANPFDAELIGFHAREQSEVTVKCTPKSYPEEKVGLLVKQDDKVKVIEYSEFPIPEREALDSSGNLKHRCANLSLFCFSMNFIEHLKESAIPLHKALKASKYLNDEGVTVRSELPSAWKFETFIFDLLSQSNKVKALLYPREECFAPLKNLEGEDSPNTVKEALMKDAKRRLEKITGKKIDRDLLELAADFYYPTQALLSSWKGQLPIDDYVSN